MNKFINEKLMPPMMKFLNTKAVTAIKNGMLYPIPFIIIGAIFLILANFPQQNVADWIAQIGWAPIFNQAYLCFIWYYGPLCGFWYCLFLGEERRL